MERVQTLVVGAGVIGLACARALARAGREVFIVDTAPVIGNGISSRNSEVIHAGIYYPPGSLKAKHCVEGARRLLEFCRERDIAHNMYGKLIVATSEDQHADLAQVAERAARNGVQLTPLSAEVAREMEPQLSCTAALHSPRTAIVNSHGFMVALLQDAEDAGATLALRTSVLPGGSLLPNGGVEVRAVDGDGGEFRIQADVVVNCAGLAAPQVARSLGLPGQDVPRAHYCKGSYFALQNMPLGQSRPFSRLIYPVPEKNTAGLGVHVTLDLAGQVRFGPNTEWLEELEGERTLAELAYDINSQAEIYKVDTRQGESFYEAIRKYWPGLPDDSLVADYSGIRPKLSAPAEAARDFEIVEHRVGPQTSPSVVSLFGIESPGLTSALSISEEVLRRTQQ